MESSLNFVKINYCCNINIKPPKDPFLKSGIALKEENIFTEIFVRDSKFVKVFQCVAVARLSQLTEKSSVKENVQNVFTKFLRKK